MKEFDAQGINFYREDTERMKSMAGVMGLSFRCVKCKQTRKISGRKQAVPGDKRSGHICAACQDGTS